MAERAPRRHDLVHLAPTAWAALLRDGGCVGHAALLAAWASSGWPLMARRRMPLDPSGGMVPVGLPLPPSAGKARLAWAIAARDIDRFGPPPTLDEAMPFAPAAWQRVGAELLRLGAAAGVVPRVFGSLAWASLTGLDYVGQGSDLDLLWELRRGQDPAPLLQSLLDLAGRSPVRLDGEIVLGDGRAVNWLELASDAPDVLVKTIDCVAVVRRRDMAWS